MADGARHALHGAVEVGVGDGREGGGLGVRADYEAVVVCGERHLLGVLARQVVGVAVLSVRWVSELWQGSGRRTTHVLAMRLHCEIEKGES